MRDIIFLFGAGASYGAGGILPERPPLGFQLYDVLSAIYPGTWGAFPAEIRQAFQNNFEVGMELVYERYGIAISQLMRDMAIYFIQFRPHERRSLYCRLIQVLRQWNLLDRVLLSTLNYECVLEYSLLNQGIMIDYFDRDGDVVDTAVPVWKLHGSCNMFCHGIQVGQGVTYGTGIVIEGGVQAFLDSNRVIEECLVRSGLAPVMCLFMKGKPLHVSPAIVSELQEKMAERVMNSRAIFCIGVNPVPEDRHIWDAVARSNADLYYIGGEQPFKNWTSAYRCGPSNFVSPFFESGFFPLTTALRKYATV